MNPTGLNPRSLVWVATETVGNALLLVGTMLLMARWVGASEFGIAALLVGTVQLANLFVEGFFHDALIQNRSVDEDMFGRALWAVLAVAIALLGLSALFLAFAPPDYARPASLLFGAALSLPFSGALGIMNARLRREFQHQEVARASIAGRITGALLGLGTAFVGGGAWALIVQYTTSVAANTIVLHARAGRPNLHSHNLRALWPLVRFAFPYACMHALSAIRLQGFTLIVTALMGLSAAGYLNLAFRLTTTPQVILTVALMNFSFPALSKNQADPQEMGRALLLVTKLVSTATLPLFAGLALCADVLVPLVLGPGWGPVTPLVQVLCVGAIVGFIRLPGSFVLRALGHVRWSFYNAGVQLILTIGGLLLFRPMGTVDALLFWVLPVLIPLAVTTSVVHRILPIGHWAQLRGVVPPLVATLAMTGAVLLFRNLFHPQSPFLDLVSRAALGGVVFTAVLLLTDRDSRKAVVRHLPWPRRSPEASKL
ncbi:oligosaccharide flippase family protein [Muricoccus radiodurans]|uniref:oligosaccharide flippase family protein n=1 Tax=Muricoccus radiodurans TaxID=2231721 RepID=UPI003CEA8732